MTNLYEPSGKQRIQSIDILRGAIMLIMALDHTRDFFSHAGINSDPTNMATTTPFLFFTRWITHFCAPNFVFLSGISAFLAGTRRTKNELTGFLIKRGLWLILVEVVFLTFAFTLNPFYNVIILQVLWVTGVSMILLGLLSRLPVIVIAMIGAVIFIGHDILDYFAVPKAGAGFVLESLLFVARGTVLPIGNDHIIFDLYAVIPWTGVMLLGYCLGSFYKSSVDPLVRKKLLRNIGLIAVALFFILRFINSYGDPAPWSVQRNGTYTILSFFNVSKYPPSLLYSLMTIGTGLIVLSLVEKVQNKFTRILVIYGNVPFFYYVLHFYLLRIINLVVFFASGYGTADIVNKESFALFHPPGFGFGLGGVYIIWFVAISILYLPCRWFSQYKKNHKQWWLSYL